MIKEHSQKTEVEIYMGGMGIIKAASALGGKEVRHVTEE